MSKITTLYKGEFVLVDMVDETVELTVENNVYSRSEAIELMDELQHSWQCTSGFAGKAKSKDIEAYRLKKVRKKDENIRSI
jgi:hypothetical protein